MTTKTQKYTSLLALLFCTATLAVRADTAVTFSVDLSVQIGDSSFNPATDTVAARSSANNFGTFTLTNNPAPNTNIYSGTITDSTDANGAVLGYKYWISTAGAPGGGWENTVSGHNRAARLPANGGSLTLPTVFYNDVGPAQSSFVTFRVNMAQQINLGNFTPGSSTIAARGDFNGFGQYNLTNDPTILTTNQFGLVSSNVYVSEATAISSPNATETFKFFIDPKVNGIDWENINAINQADGGNRFFINTGNQTLPILDFADQPFAPIATNSVFFQVDMSLQILGGNYDPNNFIVGVAGAFTSWATGAVQLTNDPAGPQPNVYSQTIPVVDGVGASEQYKFVHTTAGDLNWETPGPFTPQIGGNRFFIQGNTNHTTLPLVFYSDQGTSDSLLSNTVVNFTVDMTNAVGTDQSVWNTNQNVYINGDFMGWPAWNASLPQMSNNPPGSSIYTFQTNFHAAGPIQLTYKYSIGGTDNEAASGFNHVRFIRSENTYTFPTDTFGQQLVEQSFGNLSAAELTGSQLSVSWLGRPGVHLQTRTNLSIGSWIDHPETDALGGTNFPVTGPSLFLRLIHPGQ